MTASELVQRLLRSGYPIEVRHGCLLVDTSKGESLPVDVRDAIDEHQEVIVAALQKLAMRQHEWASLVELAAQAVSGEEARHRRWLENAVKRDSATDFSRWLQKEAPDLHDRLVHEGETLMHADCARSLLSRWSARWTNARKAFDESIGVADGMDA